MKKVLIVGVKDYVMKSVKNFLRKRGLEVVIASSFLEAKSWVMNADFDAVIADIQPNDPRNRDGLEFLSFVRWRRPLAKVFIISGYGSEEMKKNAYRLGAYCYLEKPIDFDLLRDRLADAGLIPVDKDNG